VSNGNLEQSISCGEGTLIAHVERDNRIADGRVWCVATRAIHRLMLRRGRGFVKDGPWAFREILL
jgi:hypothetical protein